jgi:hypothetical protein
MIAVGSKVYLRGCPHGEPGRVVRIERNRAKVLWADLDYLASHPLAILMEANDSQLATRKDTA